MTSIIIRRAGRAVWRGIGLSMQIGMDALALTMAYVVARLARFEFSWAQGMTGRTDWLPQLVWVVGVQLGMLLLFRVYRRMWRFTGFVDFRCTPPRWRGAWRCCGFSAFPGCAKCGRDGTSPIRFC